MPGLPIVVEARLVTARHVASLDAALFALPQSARDYGFLAPAAGPVTIPFASDGNEVILPLRINGHEHHFLLDSGAGNSFITAGAAQDCGLTATGSMPALGYGKPTTSGIATKARLEIADAIWMDGQSVYVLSDPGLAHMLSSLGNVDGGLGYDLLARFCVTVDYPHKTVTFRAAEHALPPNPDAIVLPVSLANQVPTVAATLDAKHAGRFMVDTGDSGWLHLYTQFARSGRFAPRRPPGRFDAHRRGHWRRNSGANFP